MHNGLRVDSHSVRSRKLTMLIKGPKFPQIRHTQATIRLATGISRPIIYRSHLPVDSDSDSQYG